MVKLQEVYLRDPVDYKSLQGGKANRLMVSTGGRGAAGNSLELYAEECPGVGLTVFATSTRSIKTRIPWHQVTQWVPAGEEPARATKRGRARPE